MARTTHISVVLVAVVTGCGDEARPADELTLGDSSTSGETGLTVSYAACVREDVAAGVGDGVQGFEFSVLDRPEIPPVLTDADGCFVLQGLPAAAEVVLSFAKQGYRPRMRPIRTGTDDFTNPLTEYVAVIDGFSRFAEWSGLGDADLTLGQSSIFAYDAAGGGYLEDITMTANVPLPATCYLPHDWEPLGLDAAGCGAAGDNFGIVTTFNHEIVTLDVAISRDDASCTTAVTGDGWAMAWAVPGVANTIRVPSRPGFETFNSVTCTP